MQGTSLNVGQESLVWVQQKAKDRVPRGASNGTYAGCFGAAGTQHDSRTADVTGRNSSTGMTRCQLNKETRALGPLTVKGQLDLSEPCGGSLHSPDQQGFKPESL